MNSRPWPINKEQYDTCLNRLFPTWLKDRGGIVVYQNHVLDSSHVGDITFLPARYLAEDNKLHDAPDEWRPNDGLPSFRQQRVDHVKLEEFDGDLEKALKCFR